MSSRLLPRCTQVATLACGPKLGEGSNLPSPSSKWVAGWVAGWADAFWPTYEVFSIEGSKGSNFLIKLRMRERSMKTHRDNNRNNLLHLLPRCVAGCKIALSKDVNNTPQSPGPNLEERPADRGDAENEEGKGAA